MTSPFTRCWAVDRKKERAQPWYRKLTDDSATCAEIQIETGKGDTQAAAPNDGSAYSLQNLNPLSRLIGPASCMKANFDGDQLVLGAAINLEFGDHGRLDFDLVKV